MSNIALQAANGQYVCAESGGGREVVANRDIIRSWETFELKDLGNGTVALKAANGQYVCAEGGGGREVVANRDIIRSWETFELKDLGNGKVALKAANGQYVCAEGGGGREVVANRDIIDSWETFELIKLPESGILLTENFVNQMKVNGELAWFSREENTSTGYNWRFRPDNSGVYELAEEIVLHPSTHAVGVPGMSIWKFKPIKEGKGSVMFELYPPGQQEPAEKVVLNIEVTK